MIELVMAVCMIDQPSRCKEVTLNFEADNATPVQCNLFGQPEMAKWIAAHPNWRIAKWRCGPSGQVAKI
jgi:hypothetical protein